MKRFHTGAALTMLRWGVIAVSAMSGVTGSAAGSAERDPGVVAEPAVRTVPAPAGSARGPLMLTIQSPSGGALRLTYVADEGWQADPMAVGAKPRVAAVSMPQPDADPDMDEATRKPMTVFIDGPTGFTYFWSREHGWKFVGRLTGQVQ